MSQVLITEDILSNIAESIRGKEGTSSKIVVSDMASRISNLSINTTELSEEDKYIMRIITSFSDEDLTIIAPYSFFSCNLLTSVSLPKVTQIYFNAFQECSSLISVDLPLTTLLGACAFQNCISLTSVNLPKSLYCEAYSFYGCTSLTSISLPETTTLKEHSFTNCTSLTSISLPKVTTIDGAYIFKGDSALQEIHFGSANQATIEANTNYSSKWSATNATIYFDL